MNSLPSIVLKAGEAKQINEIQETLLRPLDYPILDDWRLAVNRRCRALLGADMAVFILRLPGESPLFSEEAEPQFLQRGGAGIREQRQSEHKADGPERILLQPRQWNMLEVIATFVPP